MTYIDVETLLSEWLRDHLTLKCYRDPKLPNGVTFEAPVAHILRSPGSGDDALSLDVAVIDVDVIAANADHARKAAERIRAALRVDLPGWTHPSGPMVSHVGTVMAPAWTTDKSPYHRTATYRVAVAGALTNP